MLRKVFNYFMQVPQPDQEELGIPEPQELLICFLAVLFLIFVCYLYC